MCVVTPAFDGAALEPFRLHSPGCRIFRFNTSADGTYRVHLNEVCDTWVTLQHRKDGYAALDKQIQGSDSRQAVVCMTLVTN